MGRTLMGGVYGARAQTWLGSSGRSNALGRLVAGTAARRRVRGAGVGRARRRSPTDVAELGCPLARLRRELAARVGGHLAGSLGEWRGPVRGDRRQLGGAGRELADGRAGSLGEIVDGLANRLEDARRRWTPRRRPCVVVTRPPLSFGPGERLVGLWFVGWARVASSRSSSLLLGAVGRPSSHERTQRSPAGRRRMVTGQSSDSGSTSTDHGASSPPSSSATGSVTAEDDVPAPAVGPPGDVGRCRTDDGDPRLRVPWLAARSRAAIAVGLPLGGRRVGQARRSA